MPATKLRWLIFTLACATSWLLYLHRYTFNFIGPELTREYGYSKTELGALFGLFYVTYGIFQIPAGVVCDLGRTRSFLAVIIVLWSGSLALFGTTGDARVLGTLRLLFGGAQAGAYPALAKVSRSWFPPPIRTTLQGLVATTSGRLGGALSPIVMATLLMGVCGLSWRAALAVMAAAGLILAGLFLWLFRESPATDERINDAERELIAGGKTKEAIPSVRPALAWSRALSNPSLLALCVQQGLAAGADAIYVSLMGAFFLDRYHVQLGSAGLLASLPLIGGALGGILGGRLNDVALRSLGPRWGRSSVGFAGTLVAAFVMLLVIRQQTALAAGVGLLIAKFFVDWNQPTMWGASSDLGGRFTGTVFAIANTAGTVATVICPPIFGLILDANTSQIAGTNGALTAHVNYGPLFLTIAGIYAACAITWLTVDCRRRLDSE